MVAGDSRPISGICRGGRCVLERGGGPSGRIVGSGEAGGDDVPGQVDDRIALRRMQSGERGALSG